MLCGAEEALASTDDCIQNDIYVFIIELSFFGVLCYYSTS